MITKEELNEKLSSITLVNYDICDAFKILHDLVKDACMSERDAAYDEGYTACYRGDPEYRNDYEAGVSAKKVFDAFGIPYSEDDIPFLRRIIWGTFEVLDFKWESCETEDGDPAIRLINTLTYSINDEVEEEENE